MLFAGWEVRIVKNCDRGLENAARGRRPRAAFSRPRSQFFTIRTDPKPANNFFFFSCHKIGLQVGLRNSVIELAGLTNHCESNVRMSESLRQETKKDVLKNRFISKYYFMIVTPSSPVNFSKIVFFWCEISCKV